MASVGLESEGNLAKFFQIEETAKWIQVNKFRRVALQLPDALLNHAFQLTQTLQKQSDINRGMFETFVLADTSYGECCVDQTAAAHNGADCIIHYGRSCLSRPTFLPTFLVYCDLGSKLDVAPFVKFADTHEFARIYIDLDVRYEGAREPLHQVFLLAKTEVSFSPIPPTELLPLSSTSSLGRDEREEIVNYASFDAVIFVGPAKSPQLDRLSFACATIPTCQVFSLDTQNFEITRSEANRALAKRYVMVEKVKDASIIGILIGTMSVALFGEVLARVKTVIEKSGRKSYSFVFGKLSPSKLANFPDIDAFVLVACKFNTLIDSKEFNKPIVTPYELEVALNNREWGKYTWEFSQLLAMSLDEAEKEEADAPAAVMDTVEEQVHFSLSTGRVMTTHRKKSTGPQTLALRYESPAAESLASKTFKGLDPAANHLTPSKAGLGQVGVAAKLFQMDDVQKEQPR